MNNIMNHSIYFNEDGEAVLVEIFIQETEEILWAEKEVVSKGLIINKLFYGESSTFLSVENGKRMEGNI